MENKKFININTILLGIVFIAIFIGSLAYYRSTLRHGAIATVYVFNETAAEIDLAKDEVYTIEGGNYVVTLEVKDGKICFENSLCPDHLCEGFGWIGSLNEYAICAPAGVGVIITDEATK